MLQMAAIDAGQCWRVIMTGIIGAMAVEVESICAAMTDCTVKTISGIDFYSGILFNSPVVTARCGIGKVSAAVCAQIMISVFSADRIINTGVAGGLAAGMRQGDIVVATGFVEHDMDTTPLGDAPGYLSGLDIIELPCDKALGQQLYSLSAADSSYSTAAGVIATGDQFVASRERSDFLRTTFGACACEMEGGAIAHVCFMAGIPFAAVRCISDNADGEAGLSYGEFVGIAAKRCAALVMSLFNRRSE